MTTIQDLPEEILYMVFKTCEGQDLKKFQSVCRAWYIPAHVTLLNEVEISNFPAVRSFIDSLNYNPNPAYLKAVKILELTGAHDDTFQLDDKLNQKLFYRFPNLKAVYMEDRKLLRNFNDEMCENFLKNCPQLAKFTVGGYFGDYDPEYRNLVYKARLLMTEVDLEEMGEEFPHEDTVQFLSNFPRLRAISGWGNNLLTNFNQLIQILEHTPNLSSIYMGSGDDSDDIAETQLISKPKEEQNKLMNQLSKIDEVNLYFLDDFCVNSLKFAMKYLTGVEDFSFYIEGNESWTETHTNTLCSLFSIIRKFKRCALQLGGMDYENAPKCFPIAMQQVFYSPTKQTKTLKLAIETGVSLHINTANSYANVDLRLDFQLTLTEIAQTFFERTYGYVDNFDLSIMEVIGWEHDDYKIYLHSYDMILAQMPHLKEIKLSITNDFVDNDDGQDGCGMKLPLVNDLTIRAQTGAKFQSLLNSYCFALPNLKSLTLLNYSGTFDKNMSEFYVKLPNYSLESLHLDMTPLKTKSLKNLQKRRNFGYFILEVDLLKTGERQLYEIPYGLSSVSRINYSDLKWYIRGVNYNLVRVTIGSLRNLEIFAYGDAPHRVRNAVHILKNNQWES